MKNILEEVQKIIAAAKVSYIASVDKNGFPNLKAMLAPRKIEGLKTFWLTTNTSSRRVAQYRQNNKASIYFHQNFRGVMLTGTMEVLEDQESKNMIWQLGDRIYYPKGKTDPDYCVLKFTAQKGRYYSDFHSQDFEVK